MTAIKTIYDALSEMSCASPLFPNDFGFVATVTNKHHLEDAFKEMINRRILAIPVVDHNTGKPLYILSMMHIVSYFIRKFDESDFKNDFIHKISHYFHPIEHKTEVTKLSEFIESSDLSLDDTKIVNSTDTLLHAVRVMELNQVHRVLVQNPKGEIENLITQSRVIQFLGVLLNIIPQAKKMVKDLPSMKRGNVIVVPETVTAYKAFKTMIEKRVSGLGVVDSKGSLVGDISISDLKLIGFDSEFWNLLGLSVKDYMTQVRGHPEKNVKSHLLSFRDTNDSSFVVSVHPEDSLGRVVQLINYIHVHRVFVVDKDNKPLAVLALHDVLCELVPQV